MRKKLVSLLLAATMAFSLTACGSGSSASGDGSTENTEDTNNSDSEEGTESTDAADSTEDTDASQAAEGVTSTTPSNELHLQIAGEPQTLDPALSSTVDAGTLAMNSFAGLYTYNSDGELIPALATDMPEISEDATEYTIHLKESKWSNGEALTANDFVYSWNRVIAPATAADYSYLFDVIARKSDDTLDVTATDDYTLQIKLNSPCPYFMGLLAFPTFLPVYQAEVEAADTDGTVPGKWVQEAGFTCNGAYTLKEWNHNESMVYVKNPNFYDADNVEIEELHFMLSEDDTATFAAYNSGDLDFIDVVPNDEITKLRESNTPDFHIIDTLGTYYIGFNVNDPIFDGKTVEEAAKMREAMSLLVDRRFIVDTVGQCDQVPADAFVMPGMSDGNGGEFKTQDALYYDAEATGAGKVEEAKQLFEEAGYTFEGSEGAYTISPSLSITYLTNSGTGHEAIAQSIQQDFSALGIEMEIKTEDWNVFVEDRKAGNFTLAREGWLADYDDPINLLEIWTSDSGNNDMQLGKGDSAAAPDWTAYDNLIDEIRTTTDFAARVDMMHEAEDMLMDTWAVIPIYFYNDLFMQKTNVENIYATVFGMKFFMYAKKS